MRTGRWLNIWGPIAAICWLVELALALMTIVYCAMARCCERTFGWGQPQPRHAENSHG